jgi:hypothetical protein
MAEDITVAGLRVDSSGVVEGVDEANDALKDAESGLDDFGKKSKKTAGIAQTFTTKLFDLKGAVKGVAAAFGIGFVIGVLIGGLRNLVTEVLKNNEAWLTFKDRLNDTFRAMILGESTIDRVKRKMEGLSSGLGIESVFSQEKIDQLVRARKTITEEIGKVNEEKLLGPVFKAMDIRQRLMNRALISLGLIEETRVQGEQNILALTGAERLLKNSLKDINTELTSQLEAFIKLGGSVAEFTELTGGVTPARKPVKNLPSEKFPIGPEPLNAFEFAGIPTPEQMEAAFNSTQLARGALQKAQIEGEIPIDRFTAAVENLKNKLVALGATKEELQELGFVVSVGAQEMEDSFDRVGAAAELASRGFSMLAEAAITALLEGGVSIKKALQQILKAIAIEATVRAIFETAQGFAKAAVQDPSASIHFTAAKFFFKTAGLAAAGALAAGSRGGGGGPGGTGIGGRAEEVIDRKSNVTVIVQGSLIGTDEDTLARDLSDLIDTARQDGNR